MANGHLHVTGRLYTDTNDIDGIDALMDHSSLGS